MLRSITGLIAGDAIAAAAQLAVRDAVGDPTWPAYTVFPDPPAALAG